MWHKWIADFQIIQHTASGFDYLYLAHLSQLNDHSSLHYFSSVKIWIKRGSHKCPTVIQHTFQLPFLSRIAESKKVLHNMKRGKKISKRSDPFTPTKQKQNLFVQLNPLCVSLFAFRYTNFFFVITNEAKNSNTNELYWSDSEALSFCQSGSNFAKNWTANYCWK